LSGLIVPFEAVKLGLCSFQVKKFNGVLPYTVSFKTGRYTEKLVVEDSSPSQNLTADQKISKFAFFSGKSCPGVPC
jgi:hypothetical protein